MTPILDRQTMRLSCDATTSTELSAGSGIATPSDMIARPSAAASAASRASASATIAGRSGSVLVEMSVDPSSTPYICSSQMSCTPPEAEKSDVWRPARAASFAVSSRRSSDPGPRTTTGAAAGRDIALAQTEACRRRRRIQLAMTMRDTRSRHTRRHRRRLCSDPREHERCET